jgi:hypothetical protein
MVKHYYFGPISPQDHADMGGESFEFAGSYWSFKVEVGLEDGFVRLYDTVGRMVPIDQEHYNDLIATFSAVSALQEDFLEAKDAVKDALSALDSIHDDAVDAGIYVQGAFSYFVTK